MQPYLFQVSYTADSWGKQLKNPANRLDIVKPVIDKAGGKIVCAYYAFGPTDIFLIVDMPDNKAAAALSLAFASGGALLKCEVTALMSVADAQSAMKAGGELTGVYKPPA
ncbi:hypothetical protein BH23CHL5_BH23CHL5_28570 [soil metagenome]